MIVLLNTKILKFSTKILNIITLGYIYLSSSCELSPLEFFLLACFAEEGGSYWVCAAPVVAETIAPVSAL